MSRVSRTAHTVVGVCLFGALAVLALIFTVSFWRETPPPLRWLAVPGVMVCAAFVSIIVAEVATSWEDRP